MNILVFLLGSSIGLGLLVLVSNSTRARLKSQVGRLTSSYISKYEVSGLDVLLAIACAVALGVVTRWPMAFVLGGLGTLVVLPIIRSTKGGSVAEKIEAIGIWADMLRDTLFASAGLGQAIISTCQLVPEAIRPEVVQLARRIEVGVPIGDALREFASQIDESSADLIVSALILASEHRAQKLADLLEALAESVRDEVNARLRIESARAPLRTSIRVIVGFSLSFALFLVLVAHQYLQPYDSRSGQIALLLVGSLYLGGLLLMGKMAKAKSLPRLNLAKTREATL